MISWHPEYDYPLEEGHTFPMKKYSLLPKLLLREEIANEEDFFQPKLLDVSKILHTHCPGYWAELEGLTLCPKKWRKTGFPQTLRIVDRERYIAQGTLQSAFLSMQTQRPTFNIAGGTHHAFKDRAEGYCLLNDQAIAAQELLIEGKVKKVLIIDLDVHQGNGTASIFQNNKNVFTFSVHGKRAYPTRKENSDLDIALENETTGKEYIKSLVESLENINNCFQAEFIFYQAGVDVLDKDKLGKLKLTLEDCYQRDLIVFEFAKKIRSPITVTMGGGYSEDINVILEAHANTFRAAQKVYL